MDPDVWVLDEPSANLDPASVEELRASGWTSLKREGKTLIIAEHRCHYLRGLADRIVVLAQGKIVEVQSGANFFSQGNSDMNRRGLRWTHLPEGLAPWPAPPAR